MRCLSWRSRDASTGRSSCARIVRRGGGSAKTVFPLRTGRRDERELLGDCYISVQVKATSSPAESLCWQPPTEMAVPLTEMFQ